MSDEIILDEIRLKEQKKAERRARKEARAAEWQAIKDGWQPKVEKHFTYLSTKYGYRLTSFDSSNWWYMRVAYQTEYAAVYIDRNVEFQDVEVTLVQIPLPSGSISWVELQHHSFSFDNLLLLRAPQLLPVFSLISGLKDAQIEASLALLAHTLPEYADDVLHGDFSILSDIEELYEQRRNNSSHQD